MDEKGSLSQTHERGAFGRQVKRRVGRFVLRGQARRRNAAQHFRGIRRHGRCGRPARYFRRSRLTYRKRFSKIKHIPKRRTLNGT